MFINQKIISWLVIRFDLEPPILLTSTLVSAMTVVVVVAFVIAKWGYENARSVFLFSEVHYNKLHVPEEKGDQEFSLPTPKYIVNKAKTLTTADFLTEKSKQLNCMDTHFCYIVK
jgi:hypothetical protein